MDANSAATHARLEKVTLPGGRQVYYNYEDANQFMSLGRVGDIADGNSGGRTKYVAYKYLGASMVVDADHPAVPTGLPEGPPSGRLTLDPNADKTYWGYDSVGRVIDQKWARSAGSAADRFAYTYDRGSNRLTRSQALKTGYNETYHYDALDRLKDANRPGDANGGSLDQSWSLTPTGNPLRGPKGWSSFISAAVTQTRTHDNANEITAISGVSLAPQYDEALPDTIFAMDRDWCCLLAVAG